MGKLDSLSADRPSFDIYVQKRLILLLHYLAMCVQSSYSISINTIRQTCFKKIPIFFLQNVEAKVGPSQSYAMPLNR